MTHNLIPCYKDLEKFFIDIVTDGKTFKRELLDINETRTKASSGDFLHEEICRANAFDITGMSENIESTTPDLSHLS